MPTARLPCSEPPTGPSSRRGTRTRRRPLRSATTRALLVLSSPQGNHPFLAVARKARTPTGRTGPQVLGPPNWRNFPPGCPGLRNHMRRGRPTAPRAALIRRRSRALPGGRLINREESVRLTRTNRRLLNRSNGATAGKEGAHARTRGSPRDGERQRSRLATPNADRLEEADREQVRDHRASAHAHEWERNAGDRRHPDRHADVDEDL